MAEANRESEPPKTKASERLEVKSEASKVAEISSSGTSEEKGESPSRTTGESSQTSGETKASKECESTSSAVPEALVPSKKGAVPKASAQSKKKADSKETSPSEKGAAAEATSPSKKETSPKGIFGSFAKWASPPKKSPKKKSSKKTPPKKTPPQKIPKKKTVKGSGSSAESDESPDKKERPATISSGKKIKETFRNVSNILFSSKVSKQPSTIEEVCLIQPELESRHEERQASKEPELLSDYDPETWEPKNLENTGQFNLNLRGQLTASYETLHPTRTDTSSLSESVSIEVERASSLPLDRVDSREGSIGDASSLEREFEELASPSKSVQGLKRFQDPIEEEEDDTMGCSPRKVRLMTPDKGPTDKDPTDDDPTEKPSDKEMN